MKLSVYFSKVLASALMLVLIFGVFVHDVKPVKAEDLTPMAEICDDGEDNDGDYLIDLSDPSCVAGVENTADLCSDLGDNDGDYLIDLSDPDCVVFNVEIEDPLVDENNAELCSDTEDNDGDYLIDLSDPDCSAFIPGEEATSTLEINTNNSNGGRSSSRRSGGTVLGTSTSATEGEVLGASTCVPYITTYMKIGQANNVEEVKLLQKFLNEYASSSLPVTGFFGPLTEAAVKKFQSDETKFILQPWVDQGLATDLTPTGYVYKTTSWFINNQKCPEVKTPVPNLR